jgi:hypothetical protein
LFFVESLSKKAVPTEMVRSAQSDRFFMMIFYQGDRYCLRKTPK